MLRFAAGAPCLSRMCKTYTDRVKTLAPGGRDKFARHQCPNGGSPDLWLVAQGMAGVAQNSSNQSTCLVLAVGRRRPSDRHGPQQILEPDQIEPPPEIVGERRQA